MLECVIILLSLYYLLASSITFLLIISIKFFISYLIIISIMGSFTSINTTIMQSAGNSPSPPIASSSSKAKTRSPSVLSNRKNKVEAEYFNNTIEEIKRRFIKELYMYEQLLFLQLLFLQLLFLQLLFLLIVFAIVVAI